MKNFGRYALRFLRNAKTSEEWAAVESDDMFQTESFCGGYDADEEAFCFSFYDEGRNEFWFQLSIDEVREVAEGTRTTLPIRLAE